MKIEDPITADVCYKASIIGRPFDISYKMEPHFIKFFAFLLLYFSIFLSSYLMSFVRFLFLVPSYVSYFPLLSLFLSRISLPSVRTSETNCSICGPGTERMSRPEFSRFTYRFWSLAHFIRYTSVRGPVSRIVNLVIYHVSLVSTGNKGESKTALASCNI